MSNADRYFVYVLRCEDDSLYTGWTVDLEKRLSIHNQGKGAKYTRSRLPVRLVYSEEHLSSSEAMKRERAIKNMDRDGKLQLIRVIKNRPL